MTSIEAAYEMAYESKEVAESQHRHGIESASVLTVLDDDIAVRIAELLGPRIQGRTVVEIGGGIGLLALHLGAIAKRVYCIEANPVWAAMFVTAFMAHKPKNVSFIFGAADEFKGQLHADVALFCTHSGVASMRNAASLLAPVVIDVYGEIIAKNPEGFDREARMSREAS